MADQMVLDPSCMTKVFVFQNLCRYIDIEFIYNRKTRGWAIEYYIELQGKNVF